MRHLAAALALVSLCACAGSYSNGGTDGGPDAGCVQRTLNVGAIDGCQADASTTASVYVSDPAQGCTVSISLATASDPCFGVASRGTLDAFDGGCAGGALSCTSPSLPGILTCT